LPPTQCQFIQVSAFKFVFFILWHQPPDRGRWKNTFHLYILVETVNTVSQLFS